ncbi:MAG: insulinase family protein, partial [Planctomycetaceae bacterium]
MVNPEISRAAFEREHGVVQRELELGQNDTNRLFYYAHATNFYGTHPAATPVIGLAGPLSKVTYEDVIAYHRQTYVPQNMVFVVVGDIDEKAVLERVCRDFVGMESGRTPNLALPEVATVVTSRTLVKPAPSLKNVTESISFQTVSLLHKDLYALDLLSAILGEGKASRLYRSVLDEKNLVTGISTSSGTPAWGMGDFEVTFRCTPDKVSAAEAAIFAEIKKIAAEGVQADELDRAKRGKAADLVNARQSVDDIAGGLARDYISTGDVAFSDAYVKKIQAVTADEVQQAAKKYLDLDRKVTTRLVPESTFALTAPTTQATQAATATVFKLPNGLRVVLNPVAGAGLVSMTFATKGGILLETPQNNGIGSMMASLSTHGAGNRTAAQINEFFDRAGGGVSGTCGNNSFLWNATVMQDSFPEALEILADIITKPTFNDKELTTLRGQTLSAIDKTDEDMRPQLSKYFRQEFFDKSPYAMLSIGTKDVVGKLTTAQIAEYHKNVIHGGDSVLTIYGSFDPADARKKIEQAFAAIPAGEAKLNMPAAREVAAAGETHVLKTDKSAAGVMVAVPGMTVENIADRFPLDVLDAIISGWELPSGWLHEELRGKQLVYVVAAYNMPGLAPGAFITMAVGQPEKAQEIVDIIKKNLVKAGTYKPTQAEIDIAVNAILTSELLNRQSMAELSQAAALDELYGFGYDFRKKTEQLYRKVTPDDVLRVGKKYLGGGMVVIVTTPKPELLNSATTKPAGK